MNPLPVQRASQLESLGPQTQWLVEELWTEQAVGILGGEPKCCKSFLALDVAVSVASGAACLRQSLVRRRGPVLLFPAEDSLAVVRQRLEGIAAAAQVPFASLPVEVITAPSLRLDTAIGRHGSSSRPQRLPIQPTGPSPAGFQRTPRLGRLQSLPAPQRLPTDLVHRTSRRPWPGPHPAPTRRIGLDRGFDGGARVHR